MLSAIVLAAGQSKRLGLSLPKPLVKIKNKPVITYSLKVLDKCSWVDEIVVAASPRTLDAVGKLRGSYKKIKRVVLGGKLRQDSVRLALEAVDPRSDWVLVHDCARPFIRDNDLRRVIAAAKRTGAAVLAVKPKATIKTLASANLVGETLDREKLREIQTPQVFKKGLLEKAYKKYSAHKVTDDASLVEKTGVKVVFAPGTYENIKITTPEDLLLAGLLAGKVKL